MEIATYYPNIVPPSQWIKQSLLYWDGLASIVPNTFWDNPDPDLEWLVRQGLFEAIHLDSVSDADTLEAIVEEIESLLSKVERTPQLQIWHAEKNDRLEYGKLPTTVESYVQNLGLIQKNENQYEIDREFLGALICICAKHFTANLSQAGRQYSLHTHSATAQLTSYEPLNESQRILNILARGILPVPGDNIAFDDILHFREQEHASLSRLRLAITEEVAVCAQAGGNALEMLESLRDKIVVEREEIRQAMRKRNWAVAGVTLGIAAASPHALPDSMANLEVLLDGAGTAALGWAFGRSRSGTTPKYSYLYRSEERFIA